MAMMRGWMKSIPCLALGVALSAGCASAPFDAARRADLAQEVIAQWTDSSRLGALRLIERYGPPDAISADALAWKGRDPWKRIVIWEEPSEGPPENLQQTVAYWVPPQMRSVLPVLDGALSVADGGTALSSRASDERLNCLALNLADEVLQGVRTPEQARAFYAKTLELASAGKSSRYLDGLMFAPWRQP